MFPCQAEWEHHKCNKVAGHDDVHHQCHCGTSWSGCTKFFMFVAKDERAIPQMLPCVHRCSSPTPCTDPRQHRCGCRIPENDRNHLSFYEKHFEQQEVLVEIRR